MPYSSNFCNAFLVVIVVVLAINSRSRDYSSLFAMTFQISNEMHSFRVLAMKSSSFYLKIVFEPNLPKLLHKTMLTGALL